LHATENLRLSSAQFARVLSLRMAGITVGVILLGALSDRFGNKRMTVGCLVLAGLACGALGVASRPVFYVLVPLLSGLLSCGFVNLNYLTQIADPPRQGRANTLYRAAGAVAAVLAPVIGARLLGASGWLFAGIGAGLCVGAWLLWRYPLGETSPPFAGWRAEIAGLAAQYRRALSEAHLMRFIHLSLLLLAAFSVSSAFAAIRLSNELGMPAARYGEVCGLASALSLGAILAIGSLFDRVNLKGCFLVLNGLSAATLLAMGLTDSAAVTAVAFVAHTVLGTATIAPSSMWISRETGAAGMGAAFSVHKVLGAAYGGVATLAFSLLEPALGISRLFIGCAAVGGVLCVGLSFLRAPAGSRAPTSVSEEEDASCNKIAGIKLVRKEVA